MAKTLDLTGLMTARMCHDLANPLGAIGNGLELLDLSGFNLGEEGNLINASLAAAKARLLIFRTAYGIHSDTDMVGPAQILALENAWNTDARVTISLPNTLISKGRLQRLVLLLQCCETALPLGGSLTVEHGQTDSTVTATGRKVVYDPTTWGVFEDIAMVAGLEPKQVQFALLAQTETAPKVEYDDTIMTVRI